MMMMMIIFITTNITKQNQQHWTSDTVPHKHHEPRTTQYSDFGYALDGLGFVPGWRNRFLSSPGNQTRSGTLVASHTCVYGDTTVFVSVQDLVHKLCYLISSKTCLPSGYGNTPV
jgi:hypothetical protein